VLSISISKAEVSVIGLIFQMCKTRRERAIEGTCYIA